MLTRIETEKLAHNFDDNYAEVAILWEFANISD